MTHSRARTAIISISSRAAVSGHPSRSFERRQCLDRQNRCADARGRVPASLS